MRLRVALFATLLLCAAPAHAQRDEDMRKASQKESTRLMAQFADCVVNDSRLRPKVDRFLVVVPGSPEFVKLANEVSADRCAPRQMGSIKMQFNLILLRLSLFEALYRERFRKSPPPAVEGLPPIDIASEFEPKGKPVAPEIAFLRQLGDCVIRQKPAEAHAFIIARSYTDEESAAIGGIMPALGMCTPEGQTLRFSRPMLRGAIAEALFKAATAPKTAAAQ